MYDAMEGATVIVCDTLTQIGPQCVTMITSHLVQVYIASSIHVGLKKKQQQLYTSLQPVNRFALHILTPEGQTKQQSVFPVNVTLQISA